ncbi:MAG: OmpA family protein [Woeseiaceae bacterium]|nr:OmpA family protein [Woeseiaceae bacterium]
MLLFAGILLLSGSAALSAPVGDWPSAGFVAEKSRHSVAIRGHLPSGRARDSLLAESAKDGIYISDVEYSRHIVLPDWWAPAVSALLRLADTAQSGQFHLARNELRVRAVRGEDAAWPDAMTALRQKLPEDFSVEEQVNVVSAVDKAAVCDTLFGSLNFEPLLFRRTFSSVKTEDYARLSRLALSLRRCPGIAVRIIGHSDAFGMSARNQVVSEQRAEAVANYLLSLGVAESQLTWEGRGDREPVASNETWEGRNLNRRVTIDRRD